MVGQQYSALEGAESLGEPGKRAEFSEESEEITVLEALYGSEEQFEKGEAHDVSKKLKDYIVDGKLIIPSTREAFGDPHPFRGKILKITYHKKGKPKGNGRPWEFETKETEIKERL